MALLRAAMEPEPTALTASVGPKQWTCAQINAANNTLSAADDLADAVQRLLVAKSARPKREDEARMALAEFVAIRARADNLDRRMAPIEDKLREIEIEYDGLIRALDRWPGLLEQAV